MDVLVGSTGFVGSNLLNNHSFDMSVNSKTVRYAYGSNPDLLVYAGVSGTKWIANRNPEKDQSIITAAIENIEKIAPKKLVLISTVDVYDDIAKKDESYISCGCNMHHYGYHRLDLEKKIFEKNPSCKIVRLPAIYGKNIKKNFIFDVINLVPPMLTEDKYSILCKEGLDVNSYYLKKDELYVLKEMDAKKYWNLRVFFSKSSFNALSFTNYKSEYQFYNLYDLWEDIKGIMMKDGTIFNIVPEPVSVLEILSLLGYKCEKNSNIPIIKYDLRTKYGNKNGYTYSKEIEKEKLMNFIFSQINFLRNNAKGEVNKNDIRLL